MIQPFKKNLRRKLLAILVTSLMVGALIVGIFLYQHFNNFLRNRFQTNLEQNLELTVYSLDIKKLEGKNSIYLKKYADDFANIFKCRVTIMDDSGLVLADSEIPHDQLYIVENHLHRPEILQAGDNPYGMNTRHSATIGQDLLYMARQIKTGNKPVGYIRLATQMDEVDSLLNYTRNYFIAGGLVVLLISSVIVILLSKKISFNLFEIIKNARQIAAGDLNSRIEIDSNDELSELSSHLNIMATKLSESLNTLHQDKYILNTVLSSINDGIIAISPDKKIIFLNETALLLINSGDHEVIGEFYYQVIRNQHLIYLIDNFLDKGVFIKDDVKTEDRVLDVSITSLNMKDSPVDGAVIVLRDISDYKRLEKVRREFVANVSHEFKTPLAAIRGYAETLLDWGLEDKKLRTKYIENIIRQSRQLENLVSDLLELARLEKKPDIEFKAFKPNPIITEVLNELKDLALAKNLKIATGLDSDEIKIMGEPEMFRAIMMNLVDNALKYTQADGEIRVESKKVKSQMSFSVIDNGIGISAKDQSRIFERFYRVDKGRSRSEGGTGLGLSIVKHMAELQNAEVFLHSEIGNGSQFTVWFNLAG